MISPTRLIASLPSNSRHLALLLGLLLLGLAVAGDALSHAPQLTPPLLAAAVVSALLSRWGVPRLRQLKLGQVIREEGPQAHSPALIRAAASSGTLSCGAWLRPSLSSARASSKKPSSSARGRLLPGREAISLVGEAKG